MVEPMITLGKKPTLANRRLAFDRLRDRGIVEKLFDDLGPRYAKRNGGYLRILKTGFRKGDNAPMALVTLMGRGERGGGGDGDGLIFTVGHGARSAEQLVAILKEAGIGTLVDVRAYPTLAATRSSPKNSLGFPRASRHRLSLGRQGARRHATLLRRSHADRAIPVRRPRPFGDPGRVCIMCAESNPSDCHRSSIADWLVARRAGDASAGSRQARGASPGRLMLAGIASCMRKTQGVGGFRQPI